MDTTAFESKLDELNSHQLWGAYHALHEADAPFICLSVVMDRLIDTFGLDAFEEFSNSL